MDMRSNAVPIRTLLIAGADDAALAKELAEQLPDAEIEIERATDWAEGERRAAAGGYDVVLVAGGAESAELLGGIGRVIPKDASGPKLIVASAVAPAEIAEAAIDAGAAEVLIGDEATPQAVRRALRYAGEVRRMEGRLTDLALFDRLTGLPSHILFWQFLSHAVKRAKRHEQRFAVMSVYIDGLSAINTEGGWAKGNEVLEIVAARLRDTLRASDTVARFSGPKFSLLVESVREDADAQVVAHRIIDVLSAPLGGGATTPLNATIGVALYPASAETPEELLQSSVSAMDRAMDEGPGTIHFA